MAELLFVLVTVYVVYVVHKVISDKQAKKPETLAEKPKASVEVVSKKEEVKVAVKVEKPIAKKAAPVKAKEKAKAKLKATAKAKTKAVVSSGIVRHPETGEEAKISNNYRMVKRWIKEALVTEELLDKVYKINEIDDAAKVKINKALDKLGKMKKYQ